VTTQMVVSISPTSSAIVAHPQTNPDAKIWRVSGSLQFVLFALGFFFVFSLKQNGPIFRRARLCQIALASVFSAVLLISACSGGSQGQTITPPKIPASGSYPMSVTASSGNVSVTLNLTLNVP
ncbi:MAG: hypothetical protein ACRD52_18470, partial [Candidatus Acidiferrales bacterium]